MKPCKSHEKNQTKNMKPLVFSFSLINLIIWCILFCFFMWFSSFQILISENLGGSFMYWVDFTYSENQIVLAKLSDAWPAKKAHWNFKSSLELLLNLLVYLKTWISFQVVNFGFSAFSMIISDLNLEKLPLCINYVLTADL